MGLTRKQTLLKLIVEDFIKTAEPVGSNYLIQKYNLNISSATIRNEMNALEKEGLLEKTHTSSGRVPSNEGYKYYIENLRNSQIDENVKNEINTIFSKTASVDEVLKESCEILSHMTNLASVVLGPSADEERLVSIQLVPINSFTVTAIFVTDKGYVENKTFNLKDDLNIEDIKQCVSLLNERLKGTKVSLLVEKMSNIKPILSEYITNYNFIYDLLIKTFYDIASKRSGEIYGRENLLTQPEFKDNPEELKKLFGLFNSKQDIISIIEQAGNDILINCGDVEEHYEDVGVISKDLIANGKSMGKIAIIGPTRMDYSNVINALEYVASKIMEHFSYEGIQEKEGESTDGK